MLYLAVSFYSMKFSQICILACFPVLMVSLFAVIYDLHWLSNTAELAMYFLLLVGYAQKLNFRNMNIVLFLGFSLVAVVLNFFRDYGLLLLMAMFFQMGAYVFLTREAHQYTQRETANRFMLVFFFLMIGANCFFVYKHFQELESKLVGILEFSFYSIYYLNLLVLAIMGLIYYLNSYSRKSVYFISMVTAIVVSDILRDMVLFYLPDTSVSMLQTILHFSFILLAFQFYSTREKKLKLINLV